jgi:hypothetical protein
MRRLVEDLVERVDHRVGREAVDRDGLVAAQPLTSHPQSSVELWSGS